MPKSKSVTSKRSKPNAASGPPLQLPEGDPLDVTPDSLVLDPQNLRLLEVSQNLFDTAARLIGQSSIQEKVEGIMRDNPLFDVSSLVRSIEYNGFLKHEQLIVAPLDGEKYIVLEGNRRLTAVRTIIAKHGRQLVGLPTSVRQSLETLPCFVLRGPSIDGNETRLAEYRRASEIYIGMRHLMGAKSWEPASRYEFQWRLINEGWTVEQVAERFGRDISEVRRDLKAQTLYRDYRKFEVRRGTSHSITYNAFAEAARAGSIMKWLGWSNSNQRVEHREAEESFFSYLTIKLQRPIGAVHYEESESPAESAESVVRKLRDMLKLDDDDIEGALLDKQFDTAELLFEDRKEGVFAKRLQSYIRALKRTTASELSHNAKQNKALLLELQAQASNLLLLLDGKRRK